MKCKDLLTRLDTDDLKERLRQSPWGQGNISRGVSWLREAAEAFGVSQYRPREGSGKQVNKTREALTNEVLVAVKHAKREEQECLTDHNTQRIAEKDYWKE